MPERAVLAVDFGGTKTALALVDAAGRVGARVKLPAAHTLHESIAQVAEFARDHDPQAVGVIVPGIYRAMDGSAWAPNLWGAEYVPLLDELTAQLEVPAACGSDRAGYVLGEQWLGAARGCRDVLFVAVGTGIGVGILADGRVLEGAHGSAGAAGWMCIAGEWNPDYARAGCWETECAGPAVARRAGAASAEEVVAAAFSGDARAVSVLAETGALLGRGIANLVSLFDPEKIVLGGGLMHAFDLLIEPLRQEVERWAQPVASKSVSIEPSQLGDDAGLYGAAKLALYATTNTKD